MNGSDRNHRLSRRLPIGLALAASAAMVAGSSAVAWPTLKGFITPPVVSSTVPELFGPASAGSATLRSNGSYNTQAFVAETLVQVADIPPPRTLLTQGTDLAGHTLGMTGTPESQSTAEFDSATELSSLDNRDTSADLSSDQPEFSEETTYLPPPATRPAMAAPRPPLVRSNTSDSSTRGRLEAHWSVGKFR